MSDFLSQFPEKALLKFYSKTCQPCAQIAKILPKWEADVGIPVFKIDVEEFPHVAESFNIRKVPTFVYLVDSIEVDRFVGVPRLVQLTDMVTA